MAKSKRPKRPKLIKLTERPKQLVDTCIEYGLESVTRLTEISGVSRQTLNNWNVKKRELLRCVLLGAEVINRMRGTE